MSDLAAISSPSDPKYWDRLYLDGEDGWELGHAAPPLERWFSVDFPKKERTLVVGCGRGHEARMLARRGAEVTAIDFSAQAITAARALGDDGVSFEVRDLFDLPCASARYSLIVEHTCFCAIEVARRDEYVRVMAEVLERGGLLVGLFYAHGRSGGPPFSVTKEELQRRFEPRFVIDHLEVPSDSIERRAGQELLAVFRPR